MKKSRMKKIWIAYWIFTLCFIFWTILFPLGATLAYRKCIGETSYHIKMEVNSVMPTPDPRLWFEGGFKFSNLWCFEGLWIHKPETIEFEDGTTITTGDRSFGGLCFFGNLTFK